MAPIKEMVWDQSQFNWLIGELCIAGISILGILLILAYLKFRDRISIAYHRIKYVSMAFDLICL